MIDKISDYAEVIITLVIAVTIIELIIPNGKNKKYVMFASSLSIMIAVLNPILSVLNMDFDILESLNTIEEEMNDMEYSSSTKYDLDYNIYSSYISNLEENMKARLEDIGYRVVESKINVDKTTYEPTNIEMKIEYSDGFIQPIIIDVFENLSNNKIYEADIKKIKTFLNQNYGVHENNIIVNGV
ncbi:MAG: stage III sporulation protein AF [Clostridia bacterium]|nr:stage III sporulation protein AF [Clostridia bacterium]